jgi:hypothetical protein
MVPTFKAGLDRQTLPLLVRDGPRCTGTVSALTMDNCRGPAMTDEQAILEIAGLIVDGVAVSEALIAGDLQEARFRAHMVADHASIHGLPRVEAIAFEVVRLLGEGNRPPLPGYAEAIDDLSEELDRVITLMQQ